MATCPECDAEIEMDESDLEELEIGDPWDCDACGSRLRVANLDPIDFETDDDEDDEEEDDDEEGEDDEDDLDDDEDEADDDDDAGSDGGGWDE